MFAPKELILIIKSQFLLLYLLIIYLFHTPRPEGQLFVEGGWMVLRCGVQDIHVYSQDIPCSTGWSQGLEERGEAADQEPKATSTQPPCVDLQSVWELQIQTWPHTVLCKCIRISRWMKRFLFRFVSLIYNFLIF